MPRVCLAPEHTKTAGERKERTKEMKERKNCPFKTKSTKSTRTQVDGVGRLRSEWHQQLEKSTSFEIWDNESTLHPLLSAAAARCHGNRQ